MSSLALILTYLGCISSGAMLSMLLLLVASYVSAAIWLINHGVVYTGLLYVLVYVGAIVVLIMFVVQLTNTSLSADNNQNLPSSSLILIQNVVLSICLLILLITAYSMSNQSSTLLLSFSSLNLDNVQPVVTNSNLISGLVNYINDENHGSNLPLLASSIFNEYGYILVLSVHAIVLAVIGPIKLAIADLSS